MYSRLDWPVVDGFDLMERRQGLEHSRLPRAGGSDQNQRGVHSGSISAGSSALLMGYPQLRKAERTDGYAARQRRQLTSPKGGPADAVPQ
jgi:hypothetical protein